MEEAELKARLDGLRLEHRDLDDALKALAEGVVPDQLRLARVKKRKLSLRDEISMIEAMLIPNILA